MGPWKRSGPHGGTWTPDIGASPPSANSPSEPPGRAACQPMALNR